LPQGIRREKQWGFRKIHLSARNLYCAKLNESLLKALIKLFVNTSDTRERIKIRIYMTSLLKALLAENKIIRECTFYRGRAHAHAARGALCHECTVQSQSCMCTRKKRRGYNLPAVASSSSYIFGDIFFPRYFLFPFLLFLSLSLPPPTFFLPLALPAVPLSPENFRVRNKRESRATNGFPMAFESRLSGDE